MRYALKFIMNGVLKDFAGVDKILFFPEKS